MQDTALHLRICLLWHLLVVTASQIFFCGDNLDGFKKCWSGVVKNILGEKLVKDALLG